MHGRRSSNELLRHIRDRTGNSWDDPRQGGAANIVGDVRPAWSRMSRGVVPVPTARAVWAHLTVEMPPALALGLTLALAAFPAFAALVGRRCAPVCGDVPLGCFGLFRGSLVAQLFAGSQRLLFVLIPFELLIRGKLDMLLTARAGVFAIPAAVRVAWFFVSPVLGALRGGTIRRLRGFAGLAGLARLRSGG